MEARNVAEMQDVYFPLTREQKTKILTIQWKGEPFYEKCFVQSTFFRKNAYNRFFFN